MMVTEEYPHTESTRVYEPMYRAPGVLVEFQYTSITILWLESRPGHQRISKKAETDSQDGLCPRLRHERMIFCKLSNFSNLCR